MSVTKKQIDQFHRFATEKLDNGGAELTFQQLVALWHLEHPTDEERAEVIAAIEQGNKDIEAGNYRPAGEFMKEMRQKYNIPSDA